MGPVSGVVEKGLETVGQAFHSVMCHVPGTAEHQITKEAEKLEAAGLDVHVADGEPCHAMFSQTNRVVHLLSIFRSIAT